MIKNASVMDTCYQVFRKKKVPYKRTTTTSLRLTVTHCFGFATTLIELASFSQSVKKKD